MSKNPFRKVRGISDQDLHGALTHHTGVLQALAGAVSNLLRERRLLLLLHLVQAAALIYLLWRVA